MLCPGAPLQTAKHTANQCAARSRKDRLEGTGEGVMHRARDLSASYRGRDFLIIEYWKPWMTCDSQRHLSVSDFKGSICLNLSVTSNCFTFKCLDRFVIPHGVSKAISWETMHCPVAKRPSLTSWALTVCFSEFFFPSQCTFFSVNNMLSTRISSLSHRRCFPFSLTRDNWQAKLNVVSTLFRTYANILTLSRP